MALASLDFLSRFLAYDPETGVFTWRIRRGRCRPGDVAGNIDPSNGYLRIRVDGTLYYAHRLAWLFVMGVWPEDQIDHRNNDRLDNRFDNLRPATNRENARNCLRGKNNTSGLKGAIFFKRDAIWVAQITVNRRNIHLGRFGSKEAAHGAYVQASERYFGDFAKAG